MVPANDNYEIPPRETIELALLLRPLWLPGLVLSLLAGGMARLRSGLISRGWLFLFCSGIIVGGMDAVDREDLIGLLPRRSCAIPPSARTAATGLSTQIDAASRPGCARPAWSSISTVRYSLVAPTARAAA